MRLLLSVLMVLSSLQSAFGAESSAATVEATIQADGMMTLSVTNEKTRRTQCFSLRPSDPQYRQAQATLRPERSRIKQYRWQDIPDWFEQMLLERQLKSLNSGQMSNPVLRIQLISEALQRAKKRGIPSPPNSEIAGRSVIPYEGIKGTWVMNSGGCTQLPPGYLGELETRLHHLYRPATNVLGPPVQVAFRIDRLGRVSAVRVKTSSGMQEIDNAAVAAVKRARAVPFSNNIACDYVDVVAQLIQN